MPVRATDFNAVKAQFFKTYVTTTLSFVLFAGVTYFLLFTERNTVQNNMLLEDIIAVAQSIDVHKDEPSRYEGRVVHFVGPLRTLEPISEPDYNIQVQAVKLRRRVQMYQWIEEETEQETFLSEPAQESRKTYWYHKDWRDYIIDSNLFYMRPGHENPSIMPMFSDTHTAENVKIGWMLLGADAKRLVDDFYEVWSDSRPDRPDIKLHAGFYYHSENALEPEVGDMRVRFSYAGREDDIYTCVGLVEKGVLQPYSSPRFPNADPRTILRKGSYTVTALHLLESRALNAHTWKLRLLSFVQVFAAAMTLHPDWLTLFLRCTFVSSRFRRCSRIWANIVLAFCYTLLICSLPWIPHKPTFGIIMLGSAVLPLLHYSSFLSAP